MDNSRVAKRDAKGLRRQQSRRGLAVAEKVDGQEGSMSCRDQEAVKSVDTPPSKMTTETGLVGRNAAQIAPTRLAADRIQPHSAQFIPR